MVKHSGLLTDLYELTMAAGYLQTRFDATATFELFVRHLPPKRNFLVAAGLEQAGKASQQIAAAAEETARASTEAAGASEQGLKAAQEIAQAIEDIASQADELQNG